ncbi:hypothetical protein FACS1894216_20810 [Synergistales bacterium]|nr:hypothetical protein FACS1894216_20810 [Synergistales bacterium]
MSPKRESENKSNGKAMLLELFNEQPIWNTQKDMVEELGRRGISVKQATVSRWLSEIGAERDAKIDFRWTMAKIDTYKRNLKELAKLLNETRGNNCPLFRGNIGVAILKTKQSYNNLIAKKIRETFTDEVLSVFCPNDTDIIIYYRREKDEDGKLQKSQLVRDLRRLSRKEKSQDEVTD